MGDNDENSKFEITTFNDVYEILENYDTIKKLNRSKPYLMSHLI